MNLLIIELAGRLYVENFEAVVLSEYCTVSNYRYYRDVSAFRHTSQIVRLSDTITRVRFPFSPPLVTCAVRLTMRWAVRSS